ncbi:hypothetical protein [Streptomyces sp. ST2-7A]|nr:hypothetical protein [Streptomyces sp. ST2-7A]MCE7078749.1 hypothetical protein [Streptomyces sp. ST2-7A]
MSTGRPGPTGPTHCRHRELTRVGTDKVCRSCRRVIYAGSGVPPTG